jgi:predicted small metal-binding protein
MAKMLSCREAGMDCDFVARGETYGRLAAGVD